MKKHRYYPYKYCKTHQLRERRLVFCHFYLNELNENPIFYGDMIRTDKAYVESDGVVNRHNLHYINYCWSDVNMYRTINIAVYQGRFGFNVWGKFCQNIMKTISQY